MWSNKRWKNHECQEARKTDEDGGSAACALRRPGGDCGLGGGAAALRRRSSHLVPRRCRCRRWRLRYADRDGRPDERQRRGAICLARPGNRACARGHRRRQDRVRRMPWRADHGEGARRQGLRGAGRRKSAGSPVNTNGSRAILSSRACPPRSRPSIGTARPSICLRAARILRKQPRSSQPSFCACGNSVLGLQFHIEANARQREGPHRELRGRNRHRPLRAEPGDDAGRPSALARTSRRYFFVCWTT